MNLHPTDQQNALREAVRSFCAGHFSLDTLGEREATQVGRDEWRQLSELGVFSLRLPESEGGVGLGDVEAALVFEALGRNVVPGPLIWTHLAAGLVDGAASGDVIVSGVDDVGVSGGPYVVEHLELADALLVLRADGLYRVDAGQVGGELMRPPLDALTPVSRVVDLPRGERLAADVGQVRRVGLLSSVAMLTGIAGTTLDLAVTYAKTREQFGRAIGSFQALKHIMADMWVRCELARSALYGAAATLADPGVGDVDRALAAAADVCARAALSGSRACIQIHGGMGYTWEMAPHYFLKRTWVLKNGFVASPSSPRRSAVA